MTLHYSSDPEIFSSSQKSSFNLGKLKFILTSPLHLAVDESQSIACPHCNQSFTITAEARYRLNSLMSNKESMLSSEAERCVDAKLVIVMVGLPARGKSYITKKVCRYLNWLQHDTMIFNVGNRRRKVAGRPLDLSSAHCSKSSTSDSTSSCESIHTAGFFDPDNFEAGRLREKIAMETLDEAIDFLMYKGGSVAIFDATNSTVQRRQAIISRIQERGGFNLQMLFLESQCFDQVLLHSNMRLKLSSPDYKDQDAAKALADFKKRVAMYEKKYTPVGDIEEDLGVSYCQMIDVGRKFITHNINSFLATQVASYLQHFNLAGRQVWLARHGEFADGLSRDPGHKKYGVQYAGALSRFIGHERDAWNLRQTNRDEMGNPQYKSTDKEQKRFHLWTSMTECGVQTARFFDSRRYRIEHMHMLDDLNAQILGGTSTAEIKQQGNKPTQFPGTCCEGYSDVTKRLQSIILELERVTGHVLIVGGLAVIRILLAYCRDLHKDNMAGLAVPLGTIYMLEPKPYGVVYKEFEYHPESDWFLQKC